MDEDLSGKTRDELAAEVRRLRDGIRAHRDSTGHELCWHHPKLWGLLPERVEPRIEVPDWPQFLRGCIQYRQSLDQQNPHAPRVEKEHLAAPKGFSGGCACGAVRYECSAEPLMTFACHCRVCQKLSGGPYSPVVLVAAEAFRLTKGTLKHHFTESVAGRRHKRGFCPDCGSRISGGESEEPSSFIGLTASSMDDPSWYNPRFHIFTSHAQPWDTIDSQATRHEQYAPE